MKKHIILYTIILPLSVLGQKEKFSFYVQGGYLSSLYVKEALHQNILTKVDNDRHKCIVLNTGFQVRLSPRWRIGPSFTYDHFGTKRRFIEYSSLCYTMRIDRIWKETDRFSLYSGGAAGLRSIKQFENEKLLDHKWKPAYQVWLAGTTFRVHYFSLDANLGWGTAGFFNLGARIPIGK